MVCLVCNPEEVKDTLVAEDRYIRINIDNIFGNIRIIAHGENDCCYYPKFCPECGRKLPENPSVFG